MPGSARLQLAFDFGDERQRERALDPARSFLVQAPAGSGKTELLIQRYLALLARVEAPEGVVAITFTRKAAGEMRGRVLDALRSAAGPAPDERHARRTWELARAAAARDGESGWRIADCPGRLRIQTMDALFAELARRVPVLAGFGAVPDLIDDASALYRAAAENTVKLLSERDPAARAVRTLLVHLGNDLDKLAQLIVEMLAKRDQWQPLLGAADLDQDPVREELERGLHRTLAHELESLSAAFPPGWEHLRPSTVEGWQALADQLLTKEGKPRKRLPPQIEPLASIEQLVERLHRTRRLPAPHYSQTQWDILRALIEVLRQSIVSLKTVFEQEGKVDFIENALAALGALGNPDHPTDLALAFGERIEHLLIDEMQDTSLTQLSLIEQLLAGWEPGDGRTLFLVGDPMQSIYRFREAEVGIFLRAAEEGVGSLPLDNVQLTANFRSVNGLVAWVNQTFRGIFPGAPDTVTGAVPFAGSQAMKEDEAADPPVRVHPMFVRDASEEARRVVTIVEEERGRREPATVAVLVRARLQMAAIAAELKRRGIRFRAVEAEPLGDRPAVRDLVALTRALSHPADRTAWLAVLRAPWCGLLLDDLHALASRDPRATVPELLADRAGISKDGRDRLARCGAVLLEELEGVRRENLAVIVERAWRRLGGPQCLASAADEEDATAFLRLLRELETGGSLASFGLLEQRVAAMFAHPDPAAGEEVQLMTIHKAKGLEFDVVIVPGLDRPPPREGKPLLRWARGPEAILLAPVPSEWDEKEDSIGAFVSAHETEREHNERMRLLYVAATRARRRLHWLGTATAGRPPRRDTLLSLLWPAVEGEFAARLAAEGPPPTGPEPPRRTPQPIRRVPSGWRPAEPVGPPKWTPVRVDPFVAQAVTFEWVGETLRHVGTIVHAWLQRMARTGEAPPEAAVLRGPLAAAGVPAGEVEQAAQRAAAALGGAFEDERGSWILRPHEHDRREFAVSGVLDGAIHHAVVDCTFVEDGVRWIIDYKTSFHEGGGREEFLDNERERYRGQLERYARLLERGTAERTKLGLYFPLLGGWREWEAG